MKLKDVFREIRKELQEIETELKGLDKLIEEQKDANIEVHRLYPRQSYVNGRKAGIGFLKYILIELSKEEIEQELS